MQNEIDSKENIEMSEDIIAEEAENGEENKSFEIDISINASVLNDYMVYHAYTGASGILGSCFGALGIIMFVNSGCTNFIYLILGVVLIFYLPVSLSLRSAQLMKLNPVYANPLHYVLDSNGITVSQGETSQTLEWEKCIKAVSSKQSILVYTGRNNASIFPRKQLSERFPDFVATLALYMDPKKIKIKY